MTKAIVTLLILFPSLLFAQQRKDYLDENGRITSEGEAVYYRIQEPASNGLLVVRDYYSSNDQLAMEGTFSEVFPNKKGEGKCSYYFENGQLKETGEYKGGKRRGLWQEYYSNGRAAEVTLHLDDKTLYHQHWDEAGNAQLINGSGKYTTTSKTNTHHREILDSILIADFIIEEISGDSIYFMAQETAQYKGGMPALYSSIGKELVYPKSARRSGIEGKIFIEFKVDKNGRLRDINVLKGIGGGCDEEAVKVFQTKNNWIPAKVKGKPVVQIMVLPIAFKLG